MKKIYLIISFVMIIIVLLPKEIKAFSEENSFIKNNNNIKITANEKNKLNFLGFTDDEINNMDNIEFMNNVNIEGEIVAIKTKYYKSIVIYKNNYSLENRSIMDSIPSVVDLEINKKEYDELDNYLNNERSLTPGYTETTGKKLTTTIIAINGRYRLKVDLVWKNIPINRSNDVLAIGIDNIVSGIPSTKYVKQNWTVQNDCTMVCENKSSTVATWKTNSAGYGAVIDLPDNGNCSVINPDPLVPPITKNIKVTKLSSYMYFEINKLTTPINTINAYGDYAHAITSVSINTSIGFNFGNTGFGFGINFMPTVINKYDSMATAQAVWSGLNW